MRVKRLLYGVGYKSGLISVIIGTETSFASSVAQRDKTSKTAELAATMTRIQRLA